MNKLASVLLHSRTQAHVFHLRVSGPGSYAAHLALQAYYEGIIPLLDGLIEAYQGKNGLIMFENIDELSNNATIDHIVEYFDKILLIIEKVRVDKDLQDSHIQNDIDTIVTLLYSTKYKLENLA
jgi:hypothetical protein